MKKIIILLLLVLLSSCSLGNDEVFNIEKYVKKLQEETNIIYNNLTTEIEDITQSEVTVNYYDWKKIWNIDFMEDEKYPDSIYSFITINHKDYEIILTITYEFFQQSYMCSYLLEIKRDNLSSIDDIKINNSDLEFIYTNISNSLEIDVKLILDIPSKFEELKIIDEFEQSKQIVGDSYFIRKELDFPYIYNSYSYTVYQNINNLTYSYVYSFKDYSKTYSVI